LASIPDYPALVGDRGGWLSGLKGGAKSAAAVLADSAISADPADWRTWA
jgi:hypothetical protein